MYIEVRVAVERLSRWPDHVSGWISAAGAGMGVSSVPTPAGLPLPSQQAYVPDVPSPTTPLPTFEKSGEIQSASFVEVPSQQTDMLRPGIDVLVTVPPTISEQDKAEARRHLKIAKAAYAEGRRIDVEASLRQSIQSDPNIPMTYHLLGMLRLEGNNPDDALRIFEQASQKFPDDSLLHFDLGFLYFKQGVSSLAGQELKKAVNQNPSSPQADRARLILKQIAESAEETPAIQSRTIETKP